MCAAEVDAHVARRFRLQRRLGKGAYGIVWKAVDRSTGEVVAIKKIFDAFRDQTDAQRTFREIVLLQEFGGHPNIIRLLDVIRAENDRDIYLVFESMDTDLHAVIEKGTLLKDVHKRYIFYQLLRATQFLHSGHVVHRDQKPSNVLLDANCLVKLCDFGLARSLSSVPEGPEAQPLTEYVATRWYRAPEVLLSSHWYTPGVDMWSLGCILGEMLRGRPLFPGTSTLHQLQLILEAVPLPSEEDLLALGSNYSSLVLHHLGSRPRQLLDTLLPPDTPPQALDLLRRLLVFAPDKRLSAAQALQHPYVQRFHCPGQEWTRDAAFQLPVPAGVQLSATEYRNRLYQMMLERRGSGGLWGAAPEPGAAPQQPGLRRRSSGGRAPEREAPHAATSVSRQRPAPLLQLPPPGRRARPPGPAAEAPLAPAGVVSRAGRPAPSLSAQAVAQAANRALIRSDQTRVSGLRAAGARRATQAPPRDAPGPRPGRRMLGTSALQGAQGAARAALGGYSQAYGTVCRSALARLPLLPRPAPEPLRGNSRACSTLLPNPVPATLQ
ncbi:mitogen-activated protein kinase 15 [Lepus europaeus]|uniref:mitogen-activated protein kinase 15 n=1 Tax=Lepus europaeus TaxID=9983 RepID=UPI002B49D85E|nr:mitogen-activated protein kinase 15 [Lepus europaeus]